VHTVSLAARLARDNIHGKTTYGAFFHKVLSYLISTVYFTLLDYLFTHGLVGSVGTYNVED
jgi:hypothetical protein